MALKNLFFYGTLRHLPLLEVVLGEGRTDATLTEAVLDDHAVHWVKDQPFPMIVASAGARATGIVLHDPSEEDIARLNYYEGGFAYDLADVTVRTADGHRVEAEVFFPEPDLWPIGELWSLSECEKDWAEISVTAAQEAMDHYGIWSAEDLAKRLPMMRRRADTMRAARLRGPSRDHRDGAENVEVLRRDRVHSHFFALDHMVIRHPRYDGTMSESLDREAFLAGHAVVVLPYDPVRQGNRF